MGKKQVLPLVCPNCSSNKIVRNGHHYGGKLHFLCNSCNKHFTEDVAKGYPVSKIPFPTVAYLLYFRKKIPEFSNMKAFRKFASQWLICLGIKKHEVSRQTVHYWLKVYEKDLEQIISFQEACVFVHGILSENLRDVPEEIIKKKIHPYKEALLFLEQSLGRRFCVDLSHRDPLFFKELTDIISKQEVYCHRLLVEDAQQLGQPTRGLFFAGVAG